MSRYASRLLDEGVGRRVGNSAGGNSKAMAANTARKPAGGAPEAHPTTDRYAERLAPPPLKDVRGQLGQRRTLPLRQCHVAGHRVAFELLDHRGEAVGGGVDVGVVDLVGLSLIHISEPTRQA